MNIVFKARKTERGFVMATFEDRYGRECSIQESSLADEPAIWLGIMPDRMHITQPIAVALISVLQEFVETDRLFPEVFHVE